MSMSSFKLKFGPGARAEVVFEEPTEGAFVRRLLTEFPERGLPPTILYNRRPVIEFPDGSELSGARAERWVVNPDYRAVLRVERGGDETGGGSLEKLAAVAQEFYLAQATAQGLTPNTPAFVTQTNRMQQLIDVIRALGGEVRGIDHGTLHHRLVVLDSALRPIANYAGVRAPRA